MASFAFDAPLFAQAPAYSRRKRLFCWLRDRLAVRGVTAFGPVADATGWRLIVNAEDGFVTVRLAEEGPRCRAFVESSGEAQAEYEDTVAALEDALARSLSA
jgi:hypothetical protein